MLELFSHLDPVKYEISLYVLMGQGELVRRLPAHVRLLNTDYSDASVLSKEGHRNMRRNVIRAFSATADSFISWGISAGICLQ